MTTAKRSRLPDDVDFDEWLEEHGLRPSAKCHQGFYAVVHAGGDPPNDPSEVIESGPAFLSLDDARIAAHVLSRGNMPRVILRCEVVEGCPAHD